MDRTAQVTTAPDGRTIMFAEWGEPDGLPVFALHGTPGCRLDRHPDMDLLRSTGVRQITYDRAGYGGSDRHRGRRVVDCVGDVLAVADSLGIETFGIWGGSGGGPHALAVAATVPERVTRVICDVGAAPFDALGEDWWTGMDPENVKEFGWAVEGEERLAAELRTLNEQIRAMVTTDPSHLLDGFDLSESDRAVMARDDFAEVLREGMLEQSRLGVWGWVDDDLAFVSPWGFDLATIQVPTQVRYGLADVLVPAAHGAWLAGAIPGAVVELSELGHLGDPDADLVARYAWLTATAG